MNEDINEDINENPPMNITKDTLKLTFRCGCHMLIWDRDKNGEFGHVTVMNMDRCKSPCNVKRVKKTYQRSV